MSPYRINSYVKKEKTTELTFHDVLIPLTKFQLVCAPLLFLLTVLCCTPKAQANALAVSVDSIEQKSCIDRVPNDICSDASAEKAMDCIQQQQEAIDACRAEVRKHRDASHE